MYNFESMARDVAIKQDELMKQAEHHRLVKQARGEKRRFRWTGWQPPVIRISFVIVKQEPCQEVSQATS